jgi:predicted Fe-S protein YdhL (DUF1289 family)
VDSPCIASCKLNADKICVGCYRHIEEIVGWNKKSDAEHQTIYEAIALRQQKLDMTQLRQEPTSPITQAEWQQAKAALAKKQQYTDIDEHC